MLGIGAGHFDHDLLVQGTTRWSRGRATSKKLSKTHDSISGSKTKLWHRILTHCLPLSFPEADRFHRSLRSAWFRGFPRSLPVPLLHPRPDQKGCRRGWLGRRGATGIQRAPVVGDPATRAAASVGLPVHPDSDAVAMFRMVPVEGRSLIEQRNRIEARAVELLSDRRDDRLLATGC